MARVPYVDVASLDDPEVVASIERARRVGTPRPEIQLVFAHIPDAMKRFDAVWLAAVKQGVVEHELKELLRVRVARSLDCAY